MTGSFLHEPPVSPRVQALYDDDLAGDGYIWNLSRLWAHQPETLKRLFELMSQAFTPSGPRSGRSGGRLHVRVAEATKDGDASRYVPCSWAMMSASSAGYRRHTSRAPQRGADTGLTGEIGVRISGRANSREKLSDPG